MLLGVAEYKKNLWFGIFDTLNFPKYLLPKMLKYQKCESTSMEIDFRDSNFLQKIFGEN